MSVWCHTGLLSLRSRTLRTIFDVRNTFDCSQGLHRWRDILSANANALALADQVHTCDIFVCAFFYIFFVATACRRASCALSIRCLMGEHLRSMACASQSSLRCEATLALHGSNGSVDVSVACQSHGARSLLRSRMAAQTMRALSEVCS